MIRAIRHEHEHHWSLPPRRARRRPTSMWIPSLVIVLASLFVSLLRGLAARPSPAVAALSPSPARVDAVADARPEAP